MLSKKKIKILKILIFLLLLNKKRIFLFLKNNEKFTNKIPVFTFHRLVPDDIKKNKYPENKWIGSIKIFEEMIQYLYNNNYNTINSLQLYKWYIGDVEYGKKTILITFDDGNYEDYYLAYPIIKKYNFSATSFVIGKMIKNKSDPYNKYIRSKIGMDIIKKVRKEYPNFEFQSHTFNMHFPCLKNSKIIYPIYNMSYEELKKDSLKMKRFGFTTMAYPYGIFNKELQHILKNYKYLLAFKFYPSQYATRNSDRFAIPRIELNGNATIDTLKKWLNY